MSRVPSPGWVRLANTPPGLRCCPFCGSNAVAAWEWRGISRWTVTCEGCGSMGPAMAVDAANAAGAWNARSVRGRMLATVPPSCLDDDAYEACLREEIERLKSRREGRNVP